jgi:uncharacterized OB-fold protein
MVPWEKYYIKCPDCGHSFLPWNALMVTDFPGGVKQVRIWCPECKKEHLQSEYGKGEPVDDQD